MGTSFAASVADWAKRTKEAQEDVMRASINDVIEEAQRPESQSGRMPVDHGFLRNSLAMALGEASFATTRPSSKGDAGSPPETALFIEQMEPGDVARFAWTAEYAMRMENGFHGEDSLGRTHEQYGRHFVSSASVKWPAIVAANAERFKP